MLPSLGLFKNIQCPALPHCKRPNCVFSHTQQRQPQQKPSTSRTPTKQQPTGSTASIKRPLPPRNASDKAKLTKISSSDASAKIIGSKTSTTGTTQDPHHRVAHSPTFSGPPTIKADISSHTALKIRQTITNKLYEQYTRIYPLSVHNAHLASKHTQEHESKILTMTKNTAGYKQQAMSALMELKKQSIVTDPIPAAPSTESAAPSKPSFRGKQQNTAQWRSTCALLTDQNYLNNLLLSTTQLDAMQYPTTTLLTNDKGKTLSEKQQTCDRCNKPYTVKAILGSKDATACTYHFGRLRVAKSFGEKLRTYTCCGDPLGSIGCEKGPHVFKDDDMQKLHTSIPFVTVPKSSSSSDGKEKLLALDCEMGYTTIGMELIRLTVINANYQLVMDELVLPSHMVIDLNSRYSGIDTLAGVKHNLVSIRQALFDKMDQDTILLGHGLENDLKALRIIHDKVIDTSQVFPHPNGLPYRYGLRVLANKYLSKFIQEGSDGHDSFEDAATCLELVYYHHESLLK